MAEKLNTTNSDCVHELFLFLQTYILNYLTIITNCRDTLKVHKKRSRSTSRSGSRSESVSGSCVNSPPQKKPIRRRRRRRRRKRKRVRRNKSRGSSDACHVDVVPHSKVMSSSLAHPICRFPLRDSMIVAMTAFFSYWMQRTASHMHLATQHVAPPPEVPIHLS